MTAQAKALDLSVYGLLGRALRDVPRLENAACRDHTGLHDPALDDEPREATAARHARARVVCASCPALAACARWVTDHPASAPTGVVAGQVRRRWP